MSSPTVSVIVPCRNAAAFLSESLQSVRDQTLEDFECIVVDDASTDRSHEIAANFIEADSRFRLVRLSNGEGASVARNAGVGEASGRWIAMLDADDLMTPERLARLIDLGEAHHADLVFDDQIVTTYPKTWSAHHAFGFHRAIFRFSQSDFFIRSRLFRRSFPIGYMKPLIRREFLLRTGVRYDPEVPSGEDFLFYAQLFAHNPRCIGTSFAGYVYRRRRGSLSWSEDHLHFHAELGQRVLREFGPALSPQSRRALSARSKDFAEIAEAMPALAALRQKNWPRLMAMCVRHPRIAMTGMRLLRTRIIRSSSALRRAAGTRRGTSPA